MMAFDWDDFPTWGLFGAAVLALVASVAAAAIFGRQLKVSAGATGATQTRPQTAGRRAGACTGIDFMGVDTDYAPLTNTAAFAISNWSGEAIWDVHAQDGQKLGFATS